MFVFGLLFVDEAKLIHRGREVQPESFDDGFRPMNNG
jgi:hypothetical protein